MDPMMLQSLYRLIDEPNDIERLDGTVSCKDTSRVLHNVPKPINVRRTIEKQLLFKTKRCRLVNCSRSNCPFVHPGEKAHTRPSRGVIEQMVTNEIHRLERLSCVSNN